MKIYKIKKGFSLLEMTVVLIVMSVLASAVIPVMTRSFLDKAGEKVSLDISAIQDAARAYYTANNAWPTSITPTGVTPATDLETNGFLPSGWNSINPFGKAYTSAISGSVFTVSTLVSNGSQTAIANRLPTSIISGNTVSSSVPIPGSQSGGMGSPILMSANVIYQASSNGTIHAYALNYQGEGYLTGLTDSTPTPSLVLQRSGGNPAAGGGIWCNITMDVKAGNYWEVTSVQQNYGNMGPVTVYWVPKY